MNWTKVGRVFDHLHYFMCVVIYMKADPKDSYEWHPNPSSDLVIFMIACIGALHVHSVNQSRCENRIAIA